MHRQRKIQHPEATKDTNTFAVADTDTFADTDRDSVDGIVLMFLCLSDADAPLPFAAVIAAVVVFASGKLQAASCMLQVASASCVASAGKLWPPNGSFELSVGTLLGLGGISVARLCH